MFLIPSFAVLLLLRLFDSTLMNSSENATLIHFATIGFGFSGISFIFLISLLITKESTVTSIFQYIGMFTPIILFLLKALGSKIGGLSNFLSALLTPLPHYHVSNVRPSKYCG